MCELLSPVGDFECLKAAVQNGADAVYFGGDLFNARASAANFKGKELETAIEYAKLRGVKTHLTLNTLLKEHEIESAYNLAKKAYSYGIDAIIVQDLGLAKLLINNFPDLEIHASTQMSIHNLAGVRELENLGFKRVVLSREVSEDEIKHICENSNIDIEVFIHGALCISYSGQCLFSSMIGGRSGNRGECAQPCRLPYTLIDKDNNSLDKGYLLSTKDICGLEFLPKLIKYGVKSFKIEGRMKSPVYVATVTRIYRKYINLAKKYINNEIDEYIIDEQDKIDLLQVFNRGGFSTGHLDKEVYPELVFKEKQNNMGVFVGKIQRIHRGNGIITAQINCNLSIGDSITFENENSKYTISELMDLGSNNIRTASPGQIVKFGRMKGQIKEGDSVYKIMDKQLWESALTTLGKESIKIPLECNLKIHSDVAIEISVRCPQYNLNMTYTYNFIPLPAENATITKEKILTQFSKTSDNCFEFTKLEISLDDNLFIPTSILNDIRRQTISKFEDLIISSFKRPLTKKQNITFANFKANTSFYIKNSIERIGKKNNLPSFNNKSNPTVTLLLNTPDAFKKFTIGFRLNDFRIFGIPHVSKKMDIKKIYVPLKYFNDKNFEKTLQNISKEMNLYVYMPVIVRENYFSTIEKLLDKTLCNFDISGIVISNISELQMLKNISSCKEKEFQEKKYDLVANYTLNLYNSYTAKNLNNLGLYTITISPELKPEDITDMIDTRTLIAKNANYNAKTELIVSGHIPVMHTAYCFLGHSNKCYKDCKNLCSSEENTYYLKDRYGFTFKVIPDNLQTITTIYNSRNISINYEDLNVDSIRFDL